MSANDPPSDARLSPAAAYIVLVLLCGAGLLGLVWGSGSPENAQGEPKTESPPPEVAVTAKPVKPSKPAAPTLAEPSGAKLQTEDLTVGTGDTATAGDKVSVHYVGTLLDGTEFDSSRKHGDKPFVFPLGQGRVIKGWDQGVAGMKVGGKRKLTIPPELGYGARGAGEKIPPNSTLVFVVDLVSLEKTPLP